MIYPGNMNPQEAQRKAHEARMNVTTDDEKFYKEPEPLTPEQKEMIQSQYHDMRLKMEERDRREREWMVKYYEDKTDKDI